MKISSLILFIRMSLILLVFGMNFSINCSKNIDSINESAENDNKKSIFNKESVSDRIYSLPEHRSLLFVVPMIWKEDVYEPKSDKVAPWPTITYTPPEGDAFKVMISILGPANGNHDNSPEKILEIAEGGRKIVQEFAKESEIILNKIKRGNVFGYYYSVTDKAPQLPPGEYRYLTQGILSLQDLMMTFSIFTHEKDMEFEEKVIEMFRNAYYNHPSSSPSFQSPANIEGYFTYPGKTWSLVVDITDFEMNPIQLREDGLGMKASGYNEELGLMITIFIEKKEFEGDALKYREYYLKMDKKSPLIKTETKLYERGELAVYEYFVPTYQGETINQRHFNAILTHEDTWIDVHMSKVEFKQQDWKYFEKVLKSIRISE